MDIRILPLDMKLYLILDLILLKYEMKLCEKKSVAFCIRSQEIRNGTKSKFDMKSMISITID